jgi:mxaJ protein
MRSRSHDASSRRCSPWARVWLPFLLSVLPAPAGCSHAPAPSAKPRAADTHALRVCADPNNLPFSNDRLEGFENRIASLVARDLGASVRYTWWAQRRGFIRNTLKAAACDVVIGIPASVDMVLTTRPYYRSTYVFVMRAGRNAGIESFDDPALRRLRIGVQLIGDDYSNAPPAHALARRHIVSNVVGYTVYGDYSQPNPPARIVEAVARGEIDVAVAWGPLAGYFARRQRVPLTLRPVSPQIDLPSLPFVFDIAMGVRRGDTTRKAVLDGILERRRREIDGILAEYHVPRLDLASPPPPRFGSIATVGQAFRPARAALSRATALPHRSGPVATDLNRGVVPAEAGAHERYSQ